MPTSTARNEFRETRESWVACLIGDDPNSIKNQHLRILWNVAAYRVINEARGATYRKPGKNGVIEVNGLLHGLLDDCFFETQLLAVRRMTESSASASLDGKRGVWSLIPLIRDIKEHRHLLTRENMLAVEGIVYDYKSARDAERMAAEGAGIVGFRPVSVVSFISEHRHEQIDALSGVDATARATSDTIREAVFDRLISRLDQQCQQISRYVDKFVAHAATAESRKAPPIPAPQISLGELWGAHRVLHETINFVGTFILGGSNFGGVPHPIYDHLEYLDRPLVSSNKLQQLYESWTQFEREVKSWERWGPESLNAEIQRDGERAK